MNINDLDVILIPYEFYPYPKSSGNELPEENKYAVAPVDGDDVFFL
jgi:hypothetical protein